MRAAFREPVVISSCFLCGNMVQVLDETVMYHTPLSFCPAENHSGLLQSQAFPGPSVEPGAPTEGGLTPVTQKPKLEWKEKVSSSMRSPAESL